MISHFVSTIQRAESLLAVAAIATLVGAVACEHPAATEVGAAAIGASPGSPRPGRLLTASFDPRSIRKIEVGDFHFVPGQLAPVHTHAAPALGYVSKGAIAYQVEGQALQVLKAGDAFYEPVGPRILHFDNASSTEEAVFTDFNFERSGDPFIVFPEPLVVKIDRRTFPTVEVESGPEVSRIDIYAQTIEPAGSVHRQGKSLPIMAYVAGGAVELRTADGLRSFATGESFDVPAGQTEAILKNPSASDQARVITFEPVL